MKNSLCLLLLVSLCQTVSAAQPNFVVIFTDDQGYGDLSCFGIPFSHDIHPFHPHQKHFKFPPLALLENQTVIEMDPNVDFLTKRITDHVVSFIERNKNEPFFLDVPHPIPHKPLHVSPPLMSGVASEITDTLKKEASSADYAARDRLFRQAIDGKDIWPALTDEAGTPHETFFYHRGNSLNAVRSGNWKLHANDSEPTRLYILGNDIGEKKNVIKNNPEVVQRLMKHLKTFTDDIA